MMDLRTVLTISLLLMSTEITTATQPNNDTLTPSNQNISSTMKCTCPATVSPSTATTSKSSSSPPSPPLSLGHLKVNWTSDCEGKVVLLLLPPPSSSSSSPSSSLLCHSSLTLVKTLLSSPCESRSGCEGPSVLRPSKETQEGYDITEQAARRSCKSLMMQCTAQTDVQLKAYKVVTALLCCLLLVLFLIRFTKPTVRALQSRLSDRRQNRWIGPTQSHSVSYQRGKGVAQSTDVEMRMSYPALERLTVNDSREPSSNRNSGYTF